ncbi:MAG: hypothetical protein K1563_21070 [Candidatus Thiodiazotropha sp. (ex. Lucinisca nassula)]|nr:hypothetical protein [Candidatus Thiodiazotropha sp. (ex. Lucinisca nassula)]MBW9276175.1 hypothetical protein [Candidatus Thiodiazotropha sp. (ex. Lucinisca nassula)]PUB81066.1 MAG: hypothetical protein DBP01_16800 [gamma proteobacterium symbiont of Ctena orbiculata]PUB81276.1 MAG: hypothetical protein DBP02_18820 [gamma proteobacterium symbiont of Ctena orbiculata]
MKKFAVIIIFLVVGIGAFYGGYMLGYVERVKDGQLRYYLTDLWAVRGVLIGLNGKDIDQAPKTKEKLIERLKYHNQSLQVCMADNYCPALIRIIIKDTYEEAVEKLENL